MSKGWTAAFELQPGDQLLTSDGTMVTVEEVFDTGDWQPVYNLRVADWHKYFVGDTDWGWAAWAHNTYIYRGDDEPYYAQLIGLGRKSYIDKDGNLNPASLTGIDPDGRPVTQYDHELGSYRIVRKSHSPFTSFSLSDNKAKGWGRYMIVVSYDRLKQAVRSGSLPSVQIFDTEQLISLFQNESDNNFRSRAISFATDAEEVMILGVIQKQFITRVYKSI
jgi:hypothetical protein